MSLTNLKNDSAYFVTLAKAVDRGNRRLLPRDRHTMKGRVVREIVEAYGEEVIADVSPVT
ncbi:hypothetical protein H9Q09_01175 [Aurantimonas sp. DM33-3]|uniref:hypothetical protein n=1 Tax=Aurantimonas sp. DM33-3 TaxID=2766955 RepID=UPI001651DE49|nr:hypothetical protein [Aurantimonas sp. DM33-3]MBC6714797.1 hypothetical protein [Aurantimonas sp. DM33-3]